MTHPEELPTLHFQHECRSKMVLMVHFLRQKNRRPKVNCNFNCNDLSQEELREYEQWRDSAINPVVMSSLTPGEVFATAKYESEKP